MTDPQTLKNEQEKTLQTPRRQYGVLAKLLFFTFDFFYGKGRNFSKFKVLEVVARMPYQAWERIGYIAITHTFRWPLFSRKIFDYVEEARAQQDNEQWHLFMLEELVQQKGIQENVFLHRIIPQIIAFLHYHLSVLLYVLQPEWSYTLNADFEDHAEHEYMSLVKEHPELESMTFTSAFKNDYGDFKTWADVFRQIGLDERMHKEESLRRLVHARFA